MAASSKATLTTSKEAPAPSDEEKVSSGAIVDDTSFDHGTRYRPDRNVSPTLFLGGMPNVVSSGTTLLDENLPPVSTDPVIPPSNVPLETLVQRLVDKALDDKEKEALTQSAVFPGPPALTPEEAAEAQKADAEATAKVAESDHGTVGTPTQP